MRPAHVAHALDQSAAFARLSLPVKALTVGIMALVGGFLIGGAAIGPVLSYNSPDNTETLQTRFERRTVDPHGHYPEPSPYRAQTPDFGPHQGPAMGVYAKKQAQRELRGRGLPARGLSAEASEAFGAVPSQPSQPATQHRTYDRHTGTSY